MVGILFVWEEKSIDWSKLELEETGIMKEVEGKGGADADWD